MKLLSNLAILGIVAVITPRCSANNDNNFKTNDLYLGFTQSSAVDDYIIDLGQPSAAGTGGTSVKDLSSQFSATVFKNTFGNSPVGVNMAVVGGNNTFGAGDVFITQLRTNSFGNPAIPGSVITKTQVSSANLTGDVTPLQNIMGNNGGLPSASGYALDSTLSYTMYVETAGPNNFDTKVGIVPNAPINASSNIVMDLWQIPPASSTNIYYGYFTLNLSQATPAFNFTPATVTTPAPVAGFSGTPTSGSPPLSVTFADASTGYITNWVWNLGDGTSVTNATSASVTHTYGSGGPYTVSLTVKGPGGANTNTKSGYIVASSGLTPQFTGMTNLGGGKLVFSGSSGTNGVQYRILSSTNMVQLTTSWSPVYTSTFSGASFYFTNYNSTTNKTRFFRVVSP